MKRYFPLLVVSLLSTAASVFLFSNNVFAFKEDSATNAMTGSPVATTTDAAGKTKSDALQENDVSRFTNAIAQIKDFYVQPIGDKKLLEDAIRGMLTGLDPHSEYLDEDSYKTLLM